MKPTPSKIQAETSIDNVSKLNVIWVDSFQNSGQDISGQCFKTRPGFEPTPSKIQAKTSVDNVSKLGRDMKPTPSKIQAETSVDNVSKLNRDLS